MPTKSCSDARRQLFLLELPVLLDFCQSTYEAAAIPGRWDRAALERREEPYP